MGMKGKLARCSRGCLGIITNDEKQTVNYTQAVEGALTGQAYVGVHINDSEFAKAGDPWSSRNPEIVGDSSNIRVGDVNEYQTFEEAIALVQDARDFQSKAWPNTKKLNAGGRPFEEWIVLLHHYMTKLDSVYTETPGNIAVHPDGVNEVYVPNVEGRKRMRKYAAIVANLAIWAVQSAVGSAYSD